MTVPNLDRIAARRSQAIVRAHANNAKELDRVATRTLAVLQEHGVYAGFLYLYAKADKQFAKTIRAELLALLSEDLEGWPTGIGTAIDKDRWDDVSKALTSESGLLASLDTLLLVKDLIEQTLIYARYGAKAASSDQAPPQKRSESA